MIVGQGPKMVGGSKPYVTMTEHDRQNRALGFPARHNASQNKSLQNDTKSISDFWVPNGTPLQDAVHALLLQKLVHGSTVFAWIFHETGDGIKHVLTLLVMEMVRGIIDCFYTGQSPDAQSPNTKKVKWAWLGVLFTNKTWLNCMCFYEKFWRSVVGPLDV